MGIAAGRIARVECRDRVVVLVLSVANGRQCPAYFDRKPFLAWFATTGLNHPQDLVGWELQLATKGDRAMPWRKCPECGGMGYSASTLTDDWECPHCGAEVEVTEQVSPSPEPKSEDSEKPHGEENDE